MLKPMIAATAALAIAGSTFVYAQQRFDGYRGFGDGGPRAERQHHPLSADDINAFADARIAALKAGLELTPDQAKNWPAFESALRNMVQLRLQRMQARRAALGQPDTSVSPFDRLARRADAMSESSAALKQIADAGAPLYQSLDDAQKTRFTMLARMLRPRMREHGFNGGGSRQGWGYGRGRDGQGWRHRQFGENAPRFGQGGQDGHGWQRGGQFGEGDHGPRQDTQNLRGDDDGQDSQL